jgi:hypothetical protein
MTAPADQRVGSVGSIASMRVFGAGLVAVAAVLLAGCSGDDPPPISALPPSGSVSVSATGPVSTLATATVPTTTTTAPTSTSTTATPVPTAAATTVPSTVADDPAVAAALSAWDQWWSLITDPSSSPEAWSVVGDPDAVAAASELGVEFLTGGAFERYAFGSVDGEVVRVEDCAVGGGPLLVAGEPVTAGGRLASMRFVGTFETGPDSARLTSFELADRGCVPAPIADAAIAAWNNHVNVVEQFWFNRDPADPSIEQVATDPFLSDAVSIAQQSLDENFQIRELPTTDRYPEVIEYRSATVVLLECGLQNPGYGAFDLASGALREDLTPQQDPALQSLDEPTLTLLDGLWKVSERRATVNTTCEVGPSPDGLRVVGR